MKHKTMANLMRGMIILCLGCGLFMNIWWLPAVSADPASSELVTREWSILSGIALIPCYAALVIAWFIADSVAKEREFSHRNGRLFRWIFGLAVADSAFFVVGNGVLYTLGRTHLWNVYVSVPLAGLGILVAVSAAVLSHLIDRAAGLQEDSDLTI